MIDLSLVQQSNKRIASALPAKLTAVFAGATSGIGKYTLYEFVKQVPEPRVYFVGRSQDAADQIIQECKAINSKANLIFIKSDVSLVKNVDTVCRQITAQEESIELLVLSQGSFAFTKKTAEGLTVASALIWHSRFRFVHNLLPHLQRAKALKRVISVLAGTKEGQIVEDNLPGDGIPLKLARGHATCIHTLGLEMLAKQAPDVSFVHSYPGFVVTGIHRELNFFVGLLIRASTWIGWLFGAHKLVPAEETGARHIFEATSAVFPARIGEGSVQVVSRPEGVEIARGSDGVEGSGVYNVDDEMRHADAATEKRLAEYRERDMGKTIMRWIEADWKRAIEMS